jgi:hypothetical protein
MSTEQAVDRSAGEVIMVNIRSIANDDSILQEETIAASPATNANSPYEWDLESDITLTVQNYSVCAIGPSQ